MTHKQQQIGSRMKVRVGVVPPITLLKNCIVCIVSSRQSVAVCANPERYRRWQNNGTRSNWTTNDECARL